MGEGRFGEAEKQVDDTTGKAASLKTQAKSAETAFNDVGQIGKNLVASVEGRIQWLELLRAINECLPADPPKDADPSEDPEKPEPPNLAPTEEEIMSRERLYITSLNAQHTQNLEEWFASVRRFYQPPVGKADASGGEAASDSGPTGAGWVISLSGYHFHNPQRTGELIGAEYVKERLIRKLQDPNTKVFLPKGDASGERELVSLKELGIDYPVLLSQGRPRPRTIINPYVRVSAVGTDASGGQTQPASGLQPGAASMAPSRFRAGAVGPRGVAKPELPDEAVLELYEFPFVVQFTWIPTTPSQRREKAEQPEQQIPAEAIGQQPSET
jgi:type IV pilus assembly protein PilM